MSHSEQAGSVDVGMNHIFVIRHFYVVPGTIVNGRHLRSIWQVNYTVLENYVVCVCEMYISQWVSYVLAEDFVRGFCLLWARQN